MSRLFKQAPVALVRNRYSYELWARRPDFDSRQRPEIFLYSTAFTMGTMNSFSGGKAAVAKNDGAIPPPHIRFRDLVPDNSTGNFTITLSSNTVTLLEFSAHNNKLHTTSQLRYCDIPTTVGCNAIYYAYFPKCSFGYFFGLTGTNLLLQS